MDKSNEIRNILFPQLTKSEGGYYVDNSADLNLSAVIYDLKVRSADHACIDTLEEIAKRLHQVREILGADDET